MQAGPLIAIAAILELLPGCAVDDCLDTELDRRVRRPGDLSRGGDVSGERSGEGKKIKILRRSPSAGRIGGMGPTLSPLRRPCGPR